MKVWVCEDRRRRAVLRGRSGRRCRGGGQVLVARGKAGLTGQRQWRLVPPGFLLKTRPPFPPMHRAPASPLSATTTLSFTFLSPPFVPSLLHPPVPPARSPFLAPFLRFSHFLNFFPPSTSGPLQTLSGGLRGGGAGGSGMGRLRGGGGGGTQKPWDAGSMRVAGFEKKPDGVLMQRVDGQTWRDRAASALYPRPLAEACFGPKSTSSALCPSRYAWCFIKHIKMWWMDRWREEGGGRVI